MQDPLTSLEIVLVGSMCRDEALDDEMDFFRYVQTRDPGLIKEKPGERAVRFDVAPLKRGLVVEHIDVYKSDSERFVVAFQFACHRVTLADGEVRRPAKLTAGKNGKCADWEWVEWALDAFGVSAIQEVGSLAWQRAHLRPGSKAPLVL